MSENTQLVEQLKDVPVVRVFADKIVEHRAAGRINHVTVYEDRLRDIISVVAHLSGRELSGDDAAQVIQGLVQRSEA